MGEMSKYGDSVVVLQDEDRVKIHLHTEQPEDVRKQLEDLGRVVQWSEQDMAPDPQTTGDRQTPGGFMSSPMPRAPSPGRTPHGWE